MINYIIFVFGFSAVYNIVATFFYGKEYNAEYANIVKYIAIGIGLWDIILNEFKIRKEVLRFLLLFFNLLILLLLHLSQYHNLDDYAVAVGEFMRMTAFFIYAVMLVYYIGIKEVNYDKMVMQMVIMGLLISVFSFIGMYSIHLVQETRLINGIARAGNVAYDSNYLAAVLNFYSLFSLYGYIIKKNKYISFFFGLTFFVIQMVRVMTFSNGGWISIIITLLLIYVFIGLKYRYLLYRLRFMFSIILFLIFGIMILNNNIFDLVFARVIGEDNRFLDQSVGSRYYQYMYFYEYFRSNLDQLVFGVGNSIYPSLMPDHYLIHNSLLKIIGEVGVIGLIYYVIILRYSILFYKITINIAYKEISVMSIVIFSGFIGWLFQSMTIPADTSAIHWYYVIFSLVFYMDYIVRYQSISKKE